MFIADYGPNDLNSITHGIHAYGVKTLNRPNASQYGIVVTLSYKSGKWIFQLAISAGGGRFERRRIDNLPWTEWS